MLIQTFKASRTRLARKVVNVFVGSTRYWWAGWRAAMAIGAGSALQVEGWRPGPNGAAAKLSCCRAIFSSRTSHTLSIGAVFAVSTSNNSGRISCWA